MRTLWVTILGQTESCILLSFYRHLFSIFYMLYSKQPHHRWNQYYYSHVMGLETEAYTRFRCRPKIGLLSNIFLTLVHCFHLTQGHCLLKQWNQYFLNTYTLLGTSGYLKELPPFSHPPRNRDSIWATGQSLQMKYYTGSPHFVWFLGTIKMTMQTEIWQINLHNQCEKNIWSFCKNSIISLTSILEIAGTYFLVYFLWINGCLENNI